MIDGDFTAPPGAPDEFGGPITQNLGGAFPIYPATEGLQTQLNPTTFDMPFTQADDRRMKELMGEMSQIQSDKRAETLHPQLADEYLAKRQDEYNQLLGRQQNDAQKMREKQRAEITDELAFQSSVKHADLSRTMQNVHDLVVPMIDPNTNQIYHVAPKGVVERLDTGESMPSGRAGMLAGADSAGSDSTGTPSPVGTAQVGLSEAFQNRFVRQPEDGQPSRKMEIWNGPRRTLLTYGPNGETQGVQEFDAQGRPIQPGTPGDTGQGQATASPTLIADAHRAAASQIPFPSLTGNQRTDSRLISDWHDSVSRAAGHLITETLRRQTHTQDADRRTSDRTSEHEQKQLESDKKSWDDQFHRNQARLDNERKELMKVFTPDEKMPDYLKSHEAIDAKAHALTESQMGQRGVRNPYKRDQAPAATPAAPTAPSGAVESGKLTPQQTNQFKAIQDSFSPESRPDLSAAQRATVAMKVDMLRDLVKQHGDLTKAPPEVQAKAKGIADDLRKMAPKLKPVPVY